MLGSCCCSCHEDEAIEHLKAALGANLDDTPGPADAPVAVTATLESIEQSRLITLDALKLRSQQLSDGLQHGLNDGEPFPGVANGELEADRFAAGEASQLFEEFQQFNGGGKGGMAGG